MARLPEKLPQDPMPTVRSWLDDARDSGELPNPDAMTLATVNSSGQPSARIVLCKSVVVDPGYVVFYTNFDSAKGQDIAGSDKVACVFHWDALNRQIRLEGLAQRSPDAESDAYFSSRDKESQIGAWASAQSQVLANRQTLMNKHVATSRKLADLQEESGKTEIPRPPFWGGYRIWVSTVELWVRGDARLHDRGRWDRSLEPDSDGFTTGSWQVHRIQP
jgi:pyridoxamine 5'-phosphate oxidase